MGRKDIFWSTVVMAAGWTLAWSPPSLGIEDDLAIVVGGGLVIGVAQWVVTTKRFGASAWWALEYGLGWAAGLWCGFRFSFFVPHPFWMGGVGGALVGMMQWLTLRNVWWIPTSIAIGLVACWLGVFAGSSANDQGVVEENAYLIGAAACGIVTGLLTSLALRRFTGRARS
jgi:hypothetical protein